MNILNILSVWDWLALVWFVLAWIFYAAYAKRENDRESSLLQVTNRYRHDWMMQTTARDPRMIDAVITQTLSQTPSFFCSTTILVIGGLLAILGANDKAVELVQDIPFVARTTTIVIEFKLVTLLVVFVYAFFRFSWSMRQYTFAALVIGSMPTPEKFMTDEDHREAYASKAARLLAFAAESFNDGLRAYYFAFAVIAWFVSPLLFATANLAVIVILYRREFKSEILSILRSDAAQNDSPGQSSGA